MSIETIKQVIVTTYPANQPPEDCAICLEVLHPGQQVAGHNAAPFEAVNELWHRFHATCLTRARNNTPSSYQFSCPTCRQPLLLQSNPPEQENLTAVSPNLSLEFRQWLDTRHANTTSPEAAEERQNWAKWREETPNDVRQDTITVLQERLLQCAAEGDYDSLFQQITNYLGASGSTTLPDEIVTTAVVCAAQQSHLEVIYYLLLDPSPLSSLLREKALMAAAQRGDINLVQGLVPSPLLISEELRGNLVEAAASYDRRERARYEIIDHLLGANNLPISDASRAKALAGAAQYGFSNIARYLLISTSPVAEQNELYDSITRLLVLASKHGDIRLARFCLSRVHRVLSPEDRGSAAAQATQEENLDILRLLLDESDPEKTPISNRFRRQAIKVARTNPLNQELRELLTDALKLAGSALLRRRSTRKKK